MRKIEGLSDREKQVLFEVALGKTNDKIADSLKITTSTVKNHNTSIMRKLDASGRTGAVVKAISKGIFSLEDIPIIHVKKDRKLDERKRT